MKKNLCYLLPLLAVVACQKEADSPALYQSEDVVITATIGDATRTVIEDAGTQVLWTPSDSINVFYKGSSNKFASTNTENVATADFSGTLSYIIGANEGSQANNSIFALSPYSSTASCDGSVISTSLSASQQASENSFSSGTYITASKSSSFNMPFYGVCGGLRFTLTRSDINQIVFEGNSEEVLAGNFNISFSDENIPAAGEVSEGSTSITLTLPDNECFKTGVWYYIVALPATLSNGFKMTFITDSATLEATSSSSVSIKRGIFGSVSEIDKNAKKVIPKDVVDLGLSVKWRTCNLGAESESGYGNYYAWGDISLTSASANWSNYKWCNGTYNTLTKYNTDSSYGTVDNRTTLLAEDDAATQILGTDWRIPTTAEWEELSSNCNKSWVYRDGHYGYLLTSRINGNTIFFPVTGFYSGSTWTNYDYDGYYWSSSLYESTPSQAWILHLYYGNFGTCKDYTRCRRMTIRPVYAPSNATDLSSTGTANCYIVNSEGEYKFEARVKGESSELIGIPTSAEVLWESFGTDVTPTVGDLVNNISLGRGYVNFTATEKKGNAVIAVKNASGDIIWSWHIWMTDQPVEQVYNNNAGTMMDRNLGATSATPGDVHALGLLYQWGRKDPFLSGDSISSSTQAASTISWPTSVSSDATTGTINYAIAHPTTFILRNNLNSDWYYTGKTLTDYTRWTMSDDYKTSYDPCPYGWRVPDGGEDGILAIAFGSSSSFSKGTGPYDSICLGMNFGSSNGLSINYQLGPASIIWYPSAGYRLCYEESLSGVGTRGEYWFSIYDNQFESTCYFYSNGYCEPVDEDGTPRSSGLSVRCMKDE